MSEKALLYMTESLKHRFLVIFEAASLKDQDFQEYILRTLLSEGRVKYLTAMNARDNGGSELRELEGPTGLLMTTTNLSLHPENETRMLSIHVNDTQDQTRRVLMASARQAVTGEDASEAVDLTPWHALQTWLEKCRAPGSHSICNGVGGADRARGDPAAARHHALMEPDPGTCGSAPGHT